MSALLDDTLLANIGRQSEPRREIVTRRDIRKYAIATGNRQRRYLDGDEAPPLYHLALFWDVVELDQLLPDGVSVDRLLPKFPLEKAMAGGLQIQYHQPIRPGDWLTATRTLTNIYEKQGRSGALIFYEVLMEVVNDDGEPVVTEKTTRILR
ncbi:MAG: MaoC family dehydratase N-terminal domain-containing protein [Pseudomonadota bacterium]